VVLQGFDEFVRKALGRHVQNPRIGMTFQKAMRDGVCKVRLAKAGAAANE
jgi:hypothetical protein